MDSYARVVVCGQYLILWIYGMLWMLMEGTAWSFEGIATNTLNRCGQLTMGAFPAWGRGGGSADCHYVIKYYEESPKQCGETKPWNNKNIYISLSHLSGERGHQTLPEIPREYRFNQKHLRSGTKPSTNTFVSYSSRIPRTHPLTLWDRMNFLPQTSPYPTDNLGQMKVPQQIDAEKCN
jgi:hypothetical protein